MKVLLTGVLLTIPVAAIIGGTFGMHAAPAVVGFGLAATIIQVVAVAAAKPAVDRSFDRFMVRWGVGMGLRLVGLALFVTAVLWRPDVFPPLPTALGFLGVLIPLLFMEPRFLK